MKLKGKVYTTVVRPAMLYGAETWATTRGQEARLEVNEMRMLRWMCGDKKKKKKLYLTPNRQMYNASHYHKITAIYTHAHTWTHVHRHSL